MPSSFTYQASQHHSRFLKPELWMGLVVLTMVLSVFQDYVYSHLQNTGFYLSESLLYNSLWSFLVPFGFLEIKLHKQFSSKQKLKNLFTTVMFSGVFTLAHILVFSSIFVLVSCFVFSPTHHFSHIFRSALSNQFYILALCYALIPHIVKFAKPIIQKPIFSNAFPDNILVKVGLKTISLETKSIEMISTEKPYTSIYANGKHYLDNRSLKAFEDLLDPNLFFRVHRSTIININCVQSITSRLNGDYDGTLKSGQTIRLSRHYRANWQALLQ